MTPRKVGTPAITTWAVSCFPSFLSTSAAVMDLFRSVSSRPLPRPPISNSPKLDLIFEVSQRYFALLQAKRLIAVYEKAVEQRQYHLHEAQVKANAGLRPQLDTYVTEAEVERAQLHLVDARNERRRCKGCSRQRFGSQRFGTRIRTGGRSDLLSS